MANDQQKLTINLTTANIFAVIIFILLFALVAPIWYHQFGWPLRDIGNFSILNIPNHPELSSLLFMVILIASLIAHELIHGLAFAHYTKDGWQSISFGVNWKAGAAYCHCSEPLKKRQYVVGALAPLVILGILPLIAGLLFRDVEVTFLSLFCAAGAAGDILVAWKLSAYPADTLVLDHTSEPGCILYTPTKEEQA
jgi:hypothetical protein